MDLLLRGRTAIVCASTQGLGRACADALAAEGVHVVINGRNADTLEAATQEIRASTGAQVTPVLADLTMPEGRNRLIAACPAPDILITNIGRPPGGDFQDWDEAIWAAAVSKHMIMPIMLIRAVIDGMIERKFGRIINITSRAVRAPMPHNSLSNSARAGLTSFVAGLSRQVAKHNVTINNVLPGPFQTGQQAASLHAIAAHHGITFEEAARDRLEEVPAERFGQPEELGRLCAYLCSSHTGFIVGQNILIDGGSVNLV